MARRRTMRGRLAVAAVVLALVWVAWTALDRLGSAIFGADAPALQDKIWLERVPRSERDIIGYLALLETDDAGRVGVNGRASAWRNAYDGLRWRVQGDKLSLAFPQAGVKVAVRWQTSWCEGPSGLDQCLTVVDGNGRRVVLYSSEDLVVPTAEGAPVTLPPLPTSLGAVDDSELELATIEALWGIGSGPS